MFYLYHITKFHLSSTKEKIAQNNKYLVDGMYNESKIEFRLSVNATSNFDILKGKLIQSKKLVNLVIINATNMKTYFNLLKSHRNNDLCAINYETCTSHAILIGKHVCLKQSYSVKVKASRLAKKFIIIKKGFPNHCTSFIQKICYLL